MNPQPSGNGSESISLKVIIPPHPPLAKSVRLETEGGWGDLNLILKMERRSPIFMVAMSIRMRLMSERQRWRFSRPMGSRSPSLLKSAAASQCLEMEISKGRGEWDYGMSRHFFKPLVQVLISSFHLPVVVT